MEEREVGVTVVITVTGPNHCGNSCRFMRDTHAALLDRWGTVIRKEQPTACLLGPEPVQLTWDKKRKQHGYRRTRLCRTSEQ